MERLTENNKVFKKVLPIINAVGDVNLQEYYLSNGEYTTKPYFISKAVTKLAELEDVLEKYGIESIEELKILLSANSKIKTNTFNSIQRLKHQLAVKDRALKLASKEAWGKRASFVSSDYGKKITNAEEYSRFFIFEAEKELKDE